MTNNLKVLMDAVFGRKVPAEFAADDYDYEAALHDEIAKLVCGKDGKFNRFMFDRNKVDLFEILSENLDEIMPRAITDALGMFTEVMRVPQGTRLEFRVTRGKQRGKQFVTRATESGNYESFRLDHESFNVYPRTIGGSGYVDFERYLDGVESITDIYEVLQAGLIDRLFEMVQEVLLASWNQAGRPSRNLVATTGFDAAAMTKLINTVMPYGAPIIYCTPEFAAEMVNAIVYTHVPTSGTATTQIKISDQDMIDVRERGYIGKFHGTPVVVMPQSFTDDTNTKLLMNPSFAYVLPAGKEKLIKMCFEGNTYVCEWDDHEGDNSINIQSYTKVGVGMYSTPNYWGIYYNANIDAGGWQAYNTSLNITVSN